ncbi:UNVERIFIED_ORG: hypothetical protein BDU10_3476 [Burkholderia sp. CF145]
MKFDALECIRLAAEQGQFVYDPDPERYPHLYRVTGFTEEEVARHQASYKPKPVNEYGTKGNLSADDDLGSKPGTVARYKPLEGVLKVKPKTELTSAGWTVRKGFRVVMQVQPDTWADIETGEIITKSEARKARAYIPVPESPSDRYLRVLTLLADCAPTERKFVAFILKMRNGRGGLFEPLTDVLNRWITYAYPDINPKNKPHKRRALKAILYKRNVLADDQTLTKPFQLLRNNTKTDNLADASRAALVLPIRAKLGRGAALASNSVETRGMH